ncbi:MAG: hypothetical protein FWD84_01690 [Oscillospiraceae bacterium]|nr:hypothetical protein [Oscillospiraceae bacterium]
MRQVLKKAMLVTLIFVLLLSTAGCSRNAGTGLSENEAHLNLLSANEPLGIVLLGDYYLLPEPLYRFLENGWEVSGGGSLRFEEIDIVVLPAGSTMQMVLEKENMRLYLDVSNAGREPVFLPYATVSRLRTGDAEKDQAVIVGGITMNTSRADAEARLQYLGVGQSAIRIRDEAHYDGQIWVRMEGNTVYSFTVELGEQYNWESLNLIFPDTSDEASEAWFMSVSYYFEGIVVGIYDIERDDMTIGETIVARDGDGNLFATVRDHRINFEEIQSGDSIKVYYGHTEHRRFQGAFIQHIDGSRIPYVRADVLVINGEIHRSVFRR